MKKVKYYLVGGKFDGEVHHFGLKSPGDMLTVIESNDYTKQRWVEIYTVSDFIIPGHPEYRVATIDGVSIQEIRTSIKNLLGFQ